VGQGDALSSLLDLVLEAILQKMNITGHIGTRSTQTLVYTDDVAIMSRSKNVLKDTLFNPLTPNDPPKSRAARPLNKLNDHIGAPNGVLKFGGILFTPI
jgi:hypothetical protein